MRTKLIIIRHGATDWSTVRRYCGRSDIELNEIGRRQALRLRHAMKGEKIDAVYSSRAKRSLQSAEIIFEGFPTTAVAGLNEIDFGIFEGLTYDELMKKYPEVYSKWLDDPRRTDIPEGERMRDFRKRVEGPFKKIIRQNKGKTVALVTHAGTIKAIISDILRIKDIWKIKLEWGSVSVIELEEKAVKLLLLNDTSYVEGCDQEA